MKNSQNPPYREKVYQALKGELGDSFTKTQEEFNTSLDNDKEYSTKVYQALKGELGDSFTKTQEEFISEVFSTPTEPKGVQATEESSEFQFPFTSGDSSLDSEKSNEQIPSTPTSEQQFDKPTPVINLSDEGIDLYERYKGAIGGTITTEQESEVQGILDSELKTRKLDGYRDVFEAEGEDFDSYKNMSFEDFVKTDVGKKRETELLDSFKSKNRRAFLAKLSDEDKVRLEERILPLYHNKSIEVNDLASEVEVQKDYILKTEEVFNEIKKRKDLGEELTEEDINLAQETAEKYLSIIDDFHKNEKELTTLLPELGSFEEQLGALKRTNNWFMDNVHRTAEAVIGGLDTIAEFIGETEASYGIKTKDLYKGVYDPIKKVLQQGVDVARSHKKEDISLDSVETPSEFLSWGREQFVSQVGNILLTATGSPELAFLGTGAAQGGSKIQELKGKNKFEDAEIRMAAIFEFIKGGAVGLLEKGILGRATKSLKNAKALVETPTKKIVSEGVVDTALETAAEFTDNTLSNIYSKQILGEDTHVLENWKEVLASSLVVSGGMQGMTRGSAIAINYAAEAVRNVADKKQYNNNKEKAQSIYTQMQALSQDNPLRKDLEKKIENLLEENSNILKKDTEKITSLTKENAEEIVKKDSKLKKLFQKRKAILLSKELDEDTKKELLEENTESIKTTTKEKEFVVENAGYDVELRKKARKQAFNKKLKEAKESIDTKSEEVDMKVEVTKEDIDKEYDTLVAETAKTEYDKRVEERKGAITPIINIAEMYLADKSKKVSDTEEAFYNNYKETDYYKNLSDEHKTRADISMKDTFRILRDRAGRQEVDNRSIIQKIKDKKKEVVTKIEKGFVQQFVEVLDGLETTYGADKIKDFKEKRVLYKKKQRNKVSVFSDRVNTFAKNIEKSSISLDLFDKLLKAQHALEADKHVTTYRGAALGVSGGIDTALAAKLLEELTPEQKADFEAFSEEYKGFVEENRVALRESGRIDEETFNAYQDYYDNYISLKGFANPDIDIDNSTKINSKLSSKSAKEEQRKGKAVESANSISNLLDAYTKTIIEGEKDIVIQSLASLYDENSDLNLFKVYDSLEEANIDEKDQDSVISFMDDGKRKHLVFHNKDLGRVFNQADSTKDLGAVFRLVMTYTNTMKSLITTYYPEFLVSNAARDTQVAFRSISRELETNPDFADVDATKVRKYMRENMISSVRFLPSILKGKDVSDTKINKYGKEFMEYGGTSGISQISVDKLKKRVEKNSREYEKGTKFISKTKGLAKGIMDTVETGNAVVENMHRFNAFSALREQGINPQTAARVAAELTIDFDQSGTHGSFLSAAYYFFNAAVQGNKVAWKNLTTFRRDKNGKITGLTRAQKGLLALPTYSFLSTLGAVAFSEEDEDGKTKWEKNPEYLKRNSLRVFLGDNDRGIVGTIPISYGANVVAYTGTLAAEYVLGIKSGEQVVTNFTQAAIDMISPITPASSDDNGILKTLTFSVVQTPINLAINENFFGSPIYNDSRFSDKSKANSGRLNTPEWYKAVAKFSNEISGGNLYRSGALDVHPETLQYIVETSAGGLGKFLSNIADTVGAIVLDDREVDVNKMSFIRKFFHSQDKMQSVYEFRDKHEFIITQDKALYEDYKEAKEKGDTKKAKELYEEGVKVSKVYAEFKLAQKELKKIQKKKRELEASTVDEDKVKRGLKYYEEATIKITLRLNGYYNKILGKTYN